MTRNKKNKILIFTGAFIGLLIIYLALFYKPDKRFNWDEDYKLDKKRPNGTWLISELLQHYQPKRKFVILDESLESSLKNAKTPSNYVFIGEEIYLDQVYTDSILAYVAKGNNAFLFTSGLPWLIQDALVAPNKIGNVEIKQDEDYLEDYQYYHFDTLFTEIVEESLNPLNPYRYIYHTRFGVHDRYWYFVNKKNLTLLGAETLGEFFGINSELDTLGGINFYAVDYGKGRFYFHTQPLQFTNIHLLDTNVVDYANAVFSYLNSGPVYWDEFNWVFNRPTSKTWTYKPNFANNSESPLKLILSTPTLKWGWYLMLVFILLFIIYEGKRKQAVIPVLADKQNTTLAHIKSLTKLYYRPDEHFPIVKKMYENFLWHLRSELKIDISKSPEKIIPIISVKSGNDEKTVKSIFDLWQKINGWGSVKTKTFLEFYTHIDQFYSKEKQ